MPTYENDGLRLHYDVFGSGPAVLCVHGATGTGPYEWSSLVSALADRYQVIVPDLRGHGRSDHRAGRIGIEFVVDDLLALLRERQLERPHVVAFSFGSEVALELELIHPGTSGSLVLLSPGLGDPKSSVPSRAQLEGGWPRTLRELHTGRHGENHWLEVMLELCERASRRPKADLGAIAAIACPILLIAGGSDDPRRIRQARIMEETHDRCRLVVVEGGRHAVHKDRPSEVASVVREFLGTAIGAR